MITNRTKSLRSKNAEKQQEKTQIQPVVQPVGVPGYMLGLQRQHGNRFVQRVIAIGGTELDKTGFRPVQNEIVNMHLTDIVNNTSRELLFTRQYREKLIRDTVLDMHQASDRFQYGSNAELARDVRQRVLASLYMRRSQGRSKVFKAFTYPNSPKHDTAGVGPRVNEAAVNYWGPIQDPGGDYYWQLSDTGRANAYQAIVTLFHEQSQPHLRTLIHCDYMVSVIQYRAWAESIGVARFNAAVKDGLISLVLKWNGFSDLERPNLVPSSTSAMTLTSDTPLKEVQVANEKDLVIGDHVVFYNHPSYEALIAGVGGVWRLENAIVVDRTGGENRYQGHGYFSPVSKQDLLSGMIEQYDIHISAAQRLASVVDRATPARRAKALQRLNDKYPNVHKKLSGGWEISGEGSCKEDVRRDLKELTKAEAPGLADPCNNGAIWVSRPVHSRAAL